MRLIVGLGNPTAKYRDTRHNIGFKVIDSLAEDNSIRFRTNVKARARIASGQICGRRVLLFKSLRFMNICGLSLSPFMLEKDIEIGDLLVICDCLDLAFGKIRLKNKGSDAGHRGMRSIINALGRNDFSRLKIGIGRCLDASSDVSEYVLSKFNPREKREFPQIIEDAEKKICEWIKNGG
ncbi:MAG: aminoacyl-tRNA hydrolase [Candidatus Omnitrophica bacterium]|nr:aminoacyl-tRNA hydrolase [Candidatus Omnitrophota bacterium]